MLYVRYEECFSCNALDSVKWINQYPSTASVTHLSITVVLGLKYFCSLNTAFSTVASVDHNKLSWRLDDVILVSEFRNKCIFIDKHNHNWRPSHINKGMAQRCSRAQVPIWLRAWKYTFFSVHKNQKTGSCLRKNEVLGVAPPPPPRPSLPQVLDMCTERELETSVIIYHFGFLFIFST